MPLLPPSGPDVSGLGLLVARPAVDVWDEGVQDRKDG